MVNNRPTVYISDNDVHWINAQVRLDRFENRAQVIRAALKHYQESREAPTEVRSVP